MQVEKITIKISEDQILELTPEQAKSLLHLLKETFSEKEIITIPQLYLQYPVNPWWNPVITCGDTSVDITNDPIGDKFQEDQPMQITFEAKQNA